MSQSTPPSPGPSASASTSAAAASRAPQPAAEVVDLVSDEDAPGAGGESNEEAEEVQRELDQVKVEMLEVEEQLSSLQALHDSLARRRDKLTALQEAFTRTAGVRSTAWDAAFAHDARCLELLTGTFGLTQFRFNQREVINATLAGVDVAVVMPAGGGKSLLYQLPALVSGGVTLVVSPLLSLIADQVMLLEQLASKRGGRARPLDGVAGIGAAALTSTASQEEGKAIYKQLEDPLSALRVLYVTPEKVANSKVFMTKMEALYKAGRLSRIAIDEAHCCSQWGHDFRPDYLKLGVLKHQFPTVAVLAVTATATAAVLKDVCRVLRIEACVHFRSSVDRPNLHYEVRDRKSSPKEALLQVASYIRDEQPANAAGIVYCFSRRDCEQVAEGLRERGINAAHYHADMDPRWRSAVHEQWSKGHIQGINKPDVRFVVHHSISKSIESYYQESGRAGRDGGDAHCLLLFRLGDVSRQHSMVFAERTGKKNLYEMVEYASTAHTCRVHASLDMSAYAAAIITTAENALSLEKPTTIIQVVNDFKKVAKCAHEQFAHLQVLANLKNFSKDDCEQLICRMLLDEVAAEFVQHSPYATNSYLKGGSFANSVLHARRKVCIQRLETLAEQPQPKQKAPAAAAATAAKTPPKVALQAAAKAQRRPRKPATVAISDEEEEDAFMAQPPGKRRRASP